MCGPPGGTERVRSCTVATARDWPPYAVLAALGALCLGAAAGMASLEAGAARPGLLLARSVAVDAAFAGGMFALSVPVVHEGLHWAVYRSAGTDPRFSRNKWAPTVLSQRPVTRQLLLVQLRLVPRLACGVSGLASTAVGSLSVAPGWHALAAGAATALAMRRSVRKDLRNEVFDRYPSTVLFRDSGHRYAPWRDRRSDTDRVGSRTRVRPRRRSRP